MGRNIVWQRLNRSPKHRWSMLRNMAASLILHERIITTTARAKALAPLMNKIYLKALKKDKTAYAKVYSLVRIKSACYKLFNNILDRYT